MKQRNSEMRSTTSAVPINTKPTQANNRVVARPKLKGRLERAMESKYGVAVLVLVALVLVAVLGWIVYREQSKEYQGVNRKKTAHDHHHHQSGDDSTAAAVRSCLSNGYDSLPMSLAAAGFVKGDYCEGYWKGQRGAPQDSLPEPQAQSAPICAEKSLLKILKAVEGRATSRDDLTAAKNERAGVFVRIERQRGLAPSRLEKDKLLGNVEYSAEVSGDKSAAICWTGDLREYYISKFHVKPHKEFVESLLKIYVRIPEA